MSATKCSTCRRRWPTPSDLAAREAHIDACANPDGACDWGSDVCWGEGWCLIDCRDVFEEYTSVAQALANIGTGVLIAHLADLLATANQAARVAHDSMHQDLATIREFYTARTKRAVNSRGAL